MRVLLIAAIVLAANLMAATAGAQFPLPPDEPADPLAESVEAPPPQPVHPSWHEPYAPRGGYLPPRPYAYGHFGAAPRSHWSRHYGYYRNYTQWTRQ